MVRVGILADRRERAESLAELLAEDSRVEVVELHTAASVGLSEFANVEVVVAAGVPADQVPPDRNVVLLLDDEELVPRARVRAWLPPATSVIELIAAIVAAAADLTVLTPAQARRWISGRGPRGEDGTLRAEALTRRELQVLKMLADGLGNKEIAAQLRISQHTAKFHVAQIMGKLDAGSRTEAVTTGIRRGLIPV